jgi:ParB family transcriptional regulator, chromosome partitioning protein
MMTENGTIRMIPVDEVTVLNPRSRNKRVFNELVTSISRLGLKKPITVSQSPRTSGFVLVCGQGRLEAFISLGQKEIPAIVIDAPEDDCYVMSLVENMARRQHSSIELMQEIGSLKERGYSVSEIAAKTDFSVEYISAILLLLDQGEERLIRAVERGVIPHSIAIEIARAKEADVQKALADAYERKVIPGRQVLAIRRIIEQRNQNGRAVTGTRVSRVKRQVTADALIRAYRKETDRQKLLVKRATLTQSRILFVVNALRRLLADEHFVTLLRAEAIQTMPRPLADRLHNA